MPGGSIDRIAQFASTLSKRNVTCGAVRMLFFMINKQKKTTKESPSCKQTQSIYSPSHASPSKVSPIQNAMYGRRTMAEAKRRAEKKAYRNVVHMYYGHRA